MSLRWCWWTAECLVSSMPRCTAGQNCSSLCGILPPSNQHSCKDHHHLLTSSSCAAVWRRPPSHSPPPQPLFSSLLNVTNPYSSVLVWKSNMGCECAISWNEMHHIMYNLMKWNAQLEICEDNINGIMITKIVRFLGHNCSEPLLRLSQVRMINETWENWLNTQCNYR